MHQQPPALNLIAGPAPANPPLFLALLLLALSLAGPYLVLRASIQAGAPSLLLVFMAGCLGLAGMVTISAALTAQLRRRADLAPRPRAQFGPHGLTFCPGKSPTSNIIFNFNDIASIHLVPRALVVDTTKSHPKPGRYRVSFTGLQTSPALLSSWLAAINHHAQTISKVD